MEKAAVRRQFQGALIYHDRIFILPQAMHGMGIALIPPFLIRQELADGRLISPCPRSFATDNGYYLVIPERKAESAALLAFRDWILQQAQAYQAASLKM